MARTYSNRGRRSASGTVARISPRDGVRLTQVSQNRAIVLAVMLAALVGWNLNAWLMPVPRSAVPPVVEFAETPDPWAVSREQRRVLEAQEGVPAPVSQLSGTRPAATQRGDGTSAQFGICGSGRRVNCVVDGDTFWLNGTKIRIADIDTPEISSPRCPAELQRGRQATQRLVGLLNAGPFTLEAGDRAQDRYGRALFRVTRGGTSLGTALVGEGLAVWYGNGRPDWC